MKINRQRKKKKKKKKKSVGTEKSSGEKTLYKEDYVGKKNCLRTN